MLPETTVPPSGPFVIWEEAGVLHLVLGNAEPIGPWTMKDILRHMRAMDPIGGQPVLVEQQALVRMSPEARAFLTRVCQSDARPVAFVADDLPDRIQGEFFVRFHKPTFPFRVFAFREEAYRWFTQFTSAVRVTAADR
ncbi:MAG: hypothetical protein JST66_09035 [Bacteroidetes bacterium]|nr:hypothetical protein [Bacteroidota bacterium]